MRHRDLFVTRREMLSRSGMGMGAVALTALLGRATPAVEAANPLAAKKPPLPAKAKRIVHLFMNGGASHVDTFDPKPSLAKFAGKPIPITLKTERRTGAAFPSPFTFKRFGQSGTEVSEIFANVGSCVDDLCIVRSMHTDIPNHGCAARCFSIPARWYSSASSFRPTLRSIPASENRMFVSCPGCRSG
jgi:hypothetical protein